MKVKVVKCRGEWAVEFSFGNQFFTIPQEGASKAEALWMAQMLRACFKSYKASLSTPN